MGKKRKSVATSLDEVDRTLHYTFCSAANSLSQLYTQSMNQQKLTFQAGERHGLEKLYQWILRQEEGGSRVNTVDILTHLQTKLDYCGDEPSMSPRAPPQNQHSPMTMQLTNSEFLVSSVSSGAPNTGQGFHTDQCDQQSKNYVFSNALSSPVHQNLQNYHITQGGHYHSVQPSVNVTRNNGDGPNFMQHQKSDSNYYNSNDSSIEMHAYSPGHESTY
ncbi:LIM and SH3 domain protein like [Actinidia chinensis var. chinensis]|uniref:LIM and SH3 domain protein like n=1 Tax=Actinidia chinensis var. chinensis TaxID=1590841 RepID=A0A2R6RNT9_ACTCC|nr:LIM and SH3 domain protein like [Actinidia chinensis var. chinensis]